MLIVVFLHRSCHFHSTSEKSFAGECQAERRNEAEKMEAKEAVKYE